VAAYRGAAPDCEGLRGHAFRFLGGSDREARDLAVRWPGLVPGAVVVARFGGEATEEAFKRLAPSCDALHIASHGFYADPECAGDSEDEELASNPLLLSGLALAGANLAGADPSGADPKGRNPEGAGPARAEDGWLTAEEISALDLSRARWVVLSACGSGLGPLESGEGVFGLRRAFEIAGAGTLITALWDVEDEAARAWIDALYDARFARGRPAAEAVRDASRRTLARLRQLGRSTHPRAWGAFVATGDWR
jgi:CHAT domain-containing protein